jgi:branched-chain amino acid transport system permease protein
VVGFWPALCLAPLVVGALGALFERYCLRRVHKFGHVPELLVTFGLSYVILELVQLVWGAPRSSSAAECPYVDQLVGRWPEHGLGGPEMFTLCSRGTPVPGHARLHDAGGAADAGVGVAAADAHPHRPGDPGALTHPEMVEALGHNVPRVFMLVFGGGAALAGWPG